MIILDGSMGNELLKRTNKPSSGLWSAQFLIDSPNLVKEVHQAVGLRRDLTKPRS